MKKPWFLGVDLGTSNCKTVLIDSSAKVLGFGASAYRDLSDQWNVSSQDPEILIKAIIQSVRVALQNAKVDSQGCEGVSVGGPLHSLLAVDKQNQPLTPVLTWAAGEANTKMKSILLEVDQQQLYQETGCPVHSLYPLYKIRYLKEEFPEIYGRATHFLSAKEFALFHLTGKYGVDYAIASGSGLLNIHKLDWSQAALEICGLGSDYFSPLYDPRHCLGRLKKNAAREMGLPDGIPVTLGSADAVNSSLGAGAVFSNQGTCMVGTSGAIRVVSSSPVIDEHSRTWCYAIDHSHWLVGGAINNGGLALTWFLDLINSFSSSREGGLISIEEVLESASQVGPGAGGVICLPYFSGERSPNWNMNARGLFFGLSQQHGIGNLARSILEGVAFRLRSIQDALCDMGLESQQLRISGGITLSELWMQIVSSVLNKDLLLPSWGETSSLGTAMWLLLSSGIIADIKEIPAFVSEKAVIHPDAEDAELYTSLYRMYRSIYNRLEDLFGEISRFQTDLSIIASTNR